MDKQERHYNINTLNIIFAVSSILLLLSLIWLLVQDYSRKWKDYQKEFRSLEIEKARVKYDGAAHDLEDQAEYQELLQSLEEAKKSFAANCTSFEELEKEIESLRAKDDILAQNHKFTKAELDAVKYRFELAKEHHSKELGAVQQEYEKLLAKTNEYKDASEESSEVIKEKEKIISECGIQVDTLEKKKSQLAKKADLLKRKLSNIDPNEMTFINNLADLTRDLPIIDLANPNYKIEQIVIKDITDDVNFMHVPKVERCITCHLGIANPEYKDDVQPFKSHPNLDQYVGKDSPHPLGSFSCTACHGGRGRGVDFSSAVHTPSSKEQAKQWKKKYDWKKMDLWEDPMLPLKVTQAGCFKCHEKEVSIKGAEKLNLGIHLVEKAGCFNCHLIKPFSDWPESGPTLKNIKSKLSKDWAYKWIEDPRSFKHNTWMPSFFNQTNNSKPQEKKRTQQEIHAMVHYLFSSSDEFITKDIPVPGDASRGKELVASVGCFACHQIQPDEDNRPTTRDLLRRQHGPNLIGLGSKTSKKWIYNWLKDPVKYHKDSLMPNLRLSNQEASDIAEFLSSDKNKGFDNKKLPQIDETIVDEITLGFLSKLETQTSARNKLHSMTLEDKLAFAGKRLIKHYGCYACHDIKGFKHTNPIGTELTEEGSKSVHKLDFGLIHMEHSKVAWFEQKLRNPRIFDDGKVKTPEEKLKMPNFNFTDEEVDALVTAIMGFVNSQSVERKKMPRTTRNLYLEEGQKVIHQYNCQGCHIIEGDGGAIRPKVADWLIEYDNRSEKEAISLIPSFSPPNLIGEGRKVHTEWLFKFLHEPSEIRPWLKTRMPSYNFKAAQLNALIKYFSALDNVDFPFTEQVDTKLTKEEFKAGELLFSKENFDCAKCHIVGDKMPGGTPDRWAPNFALSKDRLKPEWIIEWLMNPSELLPGTKMPTYFDPDDFENQGPPEILNGDEHEQIRVLRNYLLTLSDATSRSVSSSEPSHQPSSTPSDDVSPESN